VAGNDAMNRLKITKIRQDRIVRGFAPALLSCMVSMIAPRRLRTWVQLFTFITIAASSPLAMSQEYHGQILFRSMPVPGATITMSMESQNVQAISAQDGTYVFAKIAAGIWAIRIEMQGFAIITSTVQVSANMPAGHWELTLLPLDQLKIVMGPHIGEAAPPQDEKSGHDSEQDQMQEELTEEQSQDGLLINGSVNNAATSSFSLNDAFGNRRPSGKNLYSGGIAATLDNSTFDARPYSLSGFDTPKLGYNRFNGVATLGGPLNIPHLLPRGPTFFLAYQMTRDHIAQTEFGLVPTGDERSGNLSGLVNSSGQPLLIYNPATGLPFPNSVVPVSPQAQALLQLYPLPNLAPSSQYNYQVPVRNSSHQDLVQSRLDETLSARDQIYGSLNVQSMRTGNTNLFGFLDTLNALGTNASLNWQHRFNPYLFFRGSYRFSWLRTQDLPWFENRENISGIAGISGNDQDAVNWGPPQLTFSSGIATLNDLQSSFNRSRTDGFSGSVGIYRGRHNTTLGGDIRRQQWNDSFQQNPRGAFAFTGAATESASGDTATGSDLADFLLGIPDTSSLAYGDADKYLRQMVYDVYATDDWRISPDLTINIGLRWEYGAPITEIHGRLVNLDITPGFAAAGAVLGSDPIGPLTGIHYPDSLIWPDKRGFEPRVGVAWRPLPTSTFILRTGYGIYHDTSVYQSSALQLTQQSPLSKSLSVQNSATCSLTLANGFVTCPSITSNTFAVDPNFRIGYSQVWHLSAQTDVPAGLQLTVTYQGIKGTRGVQEFLPNTYPIGASSLCSDCPSGFIYETSNGNSTRQAAQVQLRKRLRNGFSASVLYTFSKSIDDDAYLGGLGHVAASSASSQSAASAESAQQAGANTASIAQNWLNLKAERSPSAFDQRHLLNLQAQYTSGEGLGGGTFMSGWKGRLLKEWIVLAQLSAGSGLPQTPIYLASVPGTGVTGTIRPDLTGSPVYVSHPSSPAAPHLNFAAYTPPVAGEWGTAGRNTIIGPNPFGFDASLARTFRPSPRLFFDFRIDATNVLNRAVFTGWVTTLNSAQFGVPMAADPMRSLKLTIRLRF
jgi:hypothetical protein